MRILFMGTPDFAVASLKRLVADGHDICGVFTQPDKPKNRGMKLIAPELDAGDVILCRETAIDPDEDAVALTARLAELGAEALHEAIGQIERGTVTRTAQDHAAHTYAPMLDKSLSPMDFSRSAQQLHDQVRGLVPWPSASMVLAGKPVKVHRTAVGGETSAPAGSVVEADKNGLAIACGDGRLLHVLELQGEGGKRMAAADYLRGHPVPLGL